MRTRVFDTHTHTHTHTQREKREWRGRKIENGVKKKKLKHKQCDFVIMKLRHYKWLT